MQTIISYQIYTMCYLKVHQVSDNNLKVMSDYAIVANFLFALVANYCHYISSNPIIFSHI